MRLAPDRSARARLGRRREPARTSSQELVEQASAGGRPRHRLAVRRARRRGRRRARHRSARARRAAADTHYEPELFDRVPADAVAALSFGGTQGILDRVQGTIDVDEISEQARGADRRLARRPRRRALGRGRALRARRRPEPRGHPRRSLRPTPDETWQTLDRLARSLSEQTDTPSRPSTENGVEVRRIATDEAHALVRAARRRHADRHDRCRRDRAASPSDGDKLVDSGRVPRGRGGGRARRRGRAASPTSTSTGCIPLVEGFAGEERRAARGARRARGARLVHPPGRRRRRDDHAAAASSASPTEPARARLGFRACCSASPSSSCRPCARTLPTPRRSSHKLLVRAGLIRQVGAGLWTYLPAGWRVHEKVVQVVREEMDAIGGQEMSMPVLTPAELWQKRAATTLPTCS